LFIPLFFKLSLISGVFIIFLVLLDTCDGGLARLQGKMTNFGRYYDRVVDQISLCGIVWAISLTYDNFFGLLLLYTIGVIYIIYSYEYICLHEFSQRSNIHKKLLKYRVDLTMFLGVNPTRIWLAIGLITGFLIPILICLSVVHIIDGIRHIFLLYIRAEGKK